MPSADPAERKLISTIAAYQSWVNRPARTEPARRAAAAHEARRARLQLRSTQARRRAAELARVADAAEAELAAHPDGGAA